MTAGDTATGVHITAPLVARLISAQYPQWAELPIAPVEQDGWDNRTFRLGDAMLVRLPSAAAYSGQVAKEQRWLPTLARHLPLPIPVPLVMGVPDDCYPWHWSVYHWLEGDNATIERIDDLREFATMLADFLVALQQIDVAAGPPPGLHNFFRGGPLSVYDSETRAAITALGDRIDTGVATAVWDASLRFTWCDSPVWIHGDVSATNLLVRDGRLSAVIDFGCLAVGDPACDLTIAWTFLSGDSREAFRAALPVDGQTWARARGWALWKGLITLAEHIEATPLEIDKARRAVDAVLDEHRASSRSV